MKTIRVYKHVLGANLAINFLSTVKIEAQLTSDSSEGQANVVVSDDDYDKALRKINEWEDSLQMFLDY